MARKTDNYFKSSTVYGTLGFGITSDGVWAWSPRTQELVTFLKTGTGLRKVYTGLPPFPTPEASRIRLAPIGFSESRQLVCLVGFSGSAGAQRSPFIYRWDSAAGWRRIPHEGVESMRRMLVGLDGDVLVLGDVASRDLRLFWETR